MTGSRPDAARLDELAARLDSVVEELDDLAFETLREAAGHRSAGRPALDKQLTQARRAAERAAHLVRRLGQE